MKGPIRPLKPGECFRLFEQKLHYIGEAVSAEDSVLVFWGWNKWKRRRYYETIQTSQLECYWKYFLKKRKK